MGINVDNKVVTLTDDHQQKVNTSLEQNPTRSDDGTLNINFVFQRIKTRRREGDNNSDGNPLIYAMKEIRKYSIDPVHRDLCMVRARAILNEMDFDADFVLPLPSSSPFCAEFSNLVSAVSGIQILETNFISKKTIGETLADNRQGPALPMTRDERKAYMSQIRQWQRSPPEAFIEMKTVPPLVRKFFEPMKSAGRLDIEDGSRILLVDDLLSTGGTLLSARNALVGHNFAVTDAVCFLSALR